MLPTGSDLLFHPIHSIRQFFEVLRLHTARVSAETAERRKRKVEDVQKRSDYRKAHGLDTEEGFGGWTAKSDAESLGPAIPLNDGTVPAAEQPPKKPLKKWLGIW